jgi:hypothetical protein
VRKSASLYAIRYLLLSSVGEDVFFDVRAASEVVVVEQTVEVLAAHINTSLSI